jgi:ribose/xylose/arabinose/galactoside ABC-type transport system permease subunit
VITRLKVPPIITTLATGILFRGIAEGLANGNYFLGFPDSFRSLGQGTLAGLLSQFWVAAIVLSVLGFGLGATRYGRWVYAVGQNERAARLSGVPSDSILIGVYVASAALASLTALIMTARLDSSAPFLGSGLELASITAAVLGGISVYGGKGTMIGCLLGVLTMSAVRAGLTLLGVTTSIQAMFVAILLLFVLLLTQVSLRSVLRSWRIPPALPGHDTGPSTREALEQEIDP